LALGFGVVLASDERLRLISLAPKQAEWMKPHEILQLVYDNVGFIDVTDHLREFMNSTGKSNPALDMLIPARPTQQAIVNPALELIDRDLWLSTARSMAAYADRKYNTNNGANSATWLFQQYQAIASQYSYASVIQYTHSGYNQRSFIATIQGTSDETVIIGGHIDSTAPGTAPGFDDDASGSAAVLETFRVILASGFRPRRTLEFHGYAAEEVGLRGSNDIAASYRTQGRDVIGMLQLDMICFPGSNGAAGVITDYTNAQLNTLIRQLFDEYTEGTYVDSRCGYGCSDHASWNSRSFASSFAFEAPFGQHNPFIHTANDVESRCDLNHVVHFLQLGVSFVIEMGV